MNTTTTSGVIKNPALAQQLLEAFDAAASGVAAARRLEPPLTVGISELSKTYARASGSTRASAWR